MKLKAIAKVLDIETSCSVIRVSSLHNSYDDHLTNVPCAVTLVIIWSICELTLYGLNQV